MRFLAASTATRVLLARTSRRTRLLLGAVVLLAVASRALLVIAAVLGTKSGDLRFAVSIGVAGAAVYGLERVARGAARIVVEGDVHRMGAHALLTTDVLAVPTNDVSRIVYDGIYQATQLVSGLMPTIIADGIVAVGVLPLLASFFSTRLLMLGVVALAIVGLGVLLVRKTTRGLEERVLDASQAVGDAMEVAVSSRLEVVARAGEQSLERTLEARLTRYVELSIRSTSANALLGRLPLVAAGVVVGAIVLIDASSRQDVSAVALSHAVLLVACVPPILGAVLGVHAATRAVTHVRPFVDLIATPQRRDVDCRGGTRITLPAPVRADTLTFAYEEGLPVLRDVSFEWSGHEPLVLVGPNGSGKSTLLLLMLGIRPPTSGSLFVGGVEVTLVDLHSLRGDVAYLPQRAYLGEAHASLRWAIELACPKATTAEIKRVLQRTGVLDALQNHGDDPLETRVGVLSAGQRQRVALARILLQDARLVLLDEPDANLDREGIQLVVRLISDLVDAGKMVVIAAHTPELAAIQGLRVALAVEEHKHKVTQQREDKS